MKAPDKIYLREFKEGGLSQVWSGIKPTEDTIIASPEYIRKDALLEWAKAEIELSKQVEIVSEDAYEEGRQQVIRLLIDYLNSM